MNCPCCGRQNMHETIVDMDNNRRYVKVYHCPFCKGAKIVQCHNCGQIVSFKIKNGHFGVFAEKCPKPKIKVLLV